MRKTTDLSEGMVVFSADGAKLGKIVACREDGFIIEKGIFFPTASRLHYEDIAGTRDGEVILRQSRANLADESAWTSREEERVRSSGAPAAGGFAEKLREKLGGEKVGAEKLGGEKVGEERLGEGMTAHDEFHVRLAEEDVRAEKRLHDIGEVRVHKRVVMKQKQITVPVMHEEVRVERVTLERRAVDDLDEGTFRESTVRIPLHEEEVEIRKYPVLKEEVRVIKQMVSEERTSTAECRTEELDIEEPTKISAAERLRRTG